MVERIPDAATPFPVWRIATLSDFVGLLERECTQDDVFFRGQSEDWPLLPKLSRLKCRSGTDHARTEEIMLRHFRRAIVGYGVTVGESQWDLLALAQHHGMATRLLDWSKNPLVALWFAIKRPSTRAASDAVVWMLCPDATDTASEDELPQAVTTIRIWEPRHVTRRISAQVGAFSVHPQRDGGFEAIQHDARFYPKLQKVLIGARHFDGIRFHLDRCGVNDASIYPDIDGLARYVEWLHSYSDDESAWPGTPSGGA